VELPHGLSPYDLAIAVLDDDPLDRLYDNLTPFLIFSLGSVYESATNEGFIDDGPDNFRESG
jgi:hypothetical protein